MSTTGHRSLSLAELGAKVRGLRIHDASPLLNADTPNFCLGPDADIHTIAQHETHGSASNVLQLPEHFGTHVDAPFHFDPSGIKIDEVAADALFMRPFKKLDLSPDDPQPGELIEVGQLIAAAERGWFLLEDGDVAIVEFGWDKYRAGGSDERELEWWGANEPGLSDDACEYLATAGVSTVACDTSACDWAVRDGEIVGGGAGHTRIFLPRGILILEGLTGLADVASQGLIAALPLKIAEGTASPLRVLLLTE